LGNCSPGLGSSKKKDTGTSVVLNAINYFVVDFVDIVLVVVGWGWFEFFYQVV
jgi:hypothetical protein